MRFTQLVTPVDDGVSRLLWRVSRDFSVGGSVTTAHLAEMFVPYYATLAAALETMQQVIDRDGPAAEVNVSSDVAALRVRQIVQAMLAEENAPPAGSGASTPKPASGDHPPRHCFTALVIVDHQDPHEGHSDPR